MLVDARNLVPLDDAAGEAEKEGVCIVYAVDAVLVEGKPAAADDLAAVRWVDVDAADEVSWAFSGDEEFVAEAVDAFSE